MKQITQHLRTGQTALDEAPAPAAGPGRVLIQSRASLISAGTERMLVEFGKASLIGKARSQPERVKQVLEKIRADGLLPTVETVFRRLDEPLPLGYCNAGVVVEAGRGVGDLRSGDRVVSNGPHAELVSVPRHLCAKIPDEVSDEQAAFTVLAAIGLQGLRLMAPTLGERVVVYGLGLIGLVTVQLLRAAGCDVLGIDLDPVRLALAERFGARVVDGRSGSDPLTSAMAWTAGHGVDGVIITASADTDDIVHQAAEMCRKRGRIVLVGVVGLGLRRADFYAKELTFQVSCSYGPGRYDHEYEDGGHDYPLGFVRWTEQRNFEAILRLLATRQLVVDDLITHRVPFPEAVTAYERLVAESGSLGVVLTYAHELERSPRLVCTDRSAAPVGTPVLGVIGAGNFAKMTLMPALAKTKGRIKYVCDVQALPAAHLARQHGAEQAVTDHRIVFDDPEVSAVLLAVGHHLHARFVVDALSAGKHVFVEKPLALTVSELGEVIRAAEAHPELLVMVGYNRRFSPHVVRAKELVAGRSEPLAMTMTVNAGSIPMGHWVHDPERGGGRIIGEACHFIDLMVHLCGARVTSVAASMMGPGPAVRDDKMAIVLAFEDGSIGTVNYFANGSRAHPKERLEIFSEGRVLVLDNFRRLTGSGFRAFHGHHLLRPDKGHVAELAAFVGALARGGAPLIPLEELVNVALASLAAVTSALEDRRIQLDSEFRDALAVRVPAAAPG
jgi:predicted dehydrogenase/threonine dehydrogenase-like Zn-dependent dehydrogenase